MCDNESDFENLLSVKQYPNANKSVGSYYLWFTNIENYDYAPECALEKPYSGCLLLEGIKKSESSVRLQPFGILEFKCSSIERDSILANCTFTYASIVDGHIKVSLFGVEEILWLEHYILQHHNGLYYNWKGLRKQVLRAKAIRARDLQDTLHISNVCVLHRWYAVSFLKRWFEMCANIPVSVKKLTDKLRSLHSSEYKWLFTQTALRYAYHANMQITLIQKTMNQMKLNLIIFPEPIVDDTDECTYSITHVMNHINQSTLVGYNLALADELLATYGKYHAILNDVMKLTKQHVGERLDSVRNKYNAYQLFISCKLDKFTETIIDRIPVNLFDLNAMQKWCTDVNSMIDETFDEQTIYKAVYNDAKGCIADPDGRQFLRLYGNSQHLLQLLDPEGTHTFHYTIENIEKLSSDTTKALLPYGMTNKTHNGKFCTFDYEKPEVRQISKRLLECRDFTCPIFATRTLNSMLYMRIIPSFNIKRLKKVSTGTLDYLIEKFMYNERLNAQTNAELINSALHFSKFFADIDIVLQSPNCKFDKMVFANDLIDMTKKIFKHLFDFQPFDHYVYCSKMDTEQTKIGIHYYCSMPPGVVLTSEVCTSLAKIFNVVRHSYPSSLGIKTVGDIFDCNVYPKSYGANNPTGHLLRGPLQCNPGGTRKLECILNTAPVTLHSKLVHGPQLHDGKPILFGRVYTSIVGSCDMSDQSFMRNQECKIINNFFTDTCYSDPKNIMSQINKRIYLFDDFDNCTLLISIINELWLNNGLQMLVTHMKTACGSNGVSYRPQDVASVGSKTTLFTYNADTKTINLNVWNAGCYSKPNFCILRPHTKQINSSAHVYVMYNAKMIRFILKSRCFKSSCHGKSIVPNVFLSMNPIYMTKSLEIAILRVFSLFLNSRLTLYSVEENSDPLEIVQPVHEGKGLNIFGKRKGKKAEISYVYMFIRNGNTTYLVLRLYPNIYTACIHTPHGSAPVKAYTCTDYKYLCDALEQEKVMSSDRLSTLKDIFNSQH